MRRKNTFFLIIICILFVKTAKAQSGVDSTNKLSFFDYHHLQKDSLPLISIKTNWKKLIRSKHKEEYQTGILSFQDAEQQAVDLNIRLRTRGNVRKEVCFYPPIKLKVKKKALRAIGFSEVNDLKMVIQCRKGSIGEGYILREYLLYQFYAVISPLHYQVKLVRLNMEDESGKVESLLAFFIEDEEEIADRLDCRVVEEGKIRDVLIDRESYLRMSFFQYMILNTDWNIPSKHNIEFVKLPEMSKIVVIPYDFDYAGLVGTSYSVPHEKLPIENVMEPYFMGKELTEEEIKETAAYFRSKKEAIYKVCKNSRLLSEKDQKRVTNYLDDFFELMEDEKYLVRKFRS